MNFWRLLARVEMREVRKARDPRLNRDIAIKVSVEQFSERFRVKSTRWLP